MSEPSLSYNPASNITLPGIGPVELQGLILVVGPNSSGKTQFLNDIRAAITGQERKNVVCEAIALKPPPDLNAFITELEENRCLKRTNQHQDQEVFSIVTWALGTPDKYAPNQVSRRTLEMWHKSFGQPSPRAEFMKFVGNLLITTLFLTNRLDTTKQCQGFDHTQSPPKNDLQAIHINSAGQQELNSEVVRAFGKSIAIDSTTTQLCLKVFDKPEPEPPRCWPDATNNLPIEQEGDGLRSFAAICVSLLAGHRPVCLIDEPESCLHPPQAHALGQFIGRHGNCECRTTLVATHSSHVLRGVLETAKSVQIIRLSHSGKTFSALSIDYEVLMESINKPIVRAETVLDGLFADAVIIVESDGDRAVYQAALDAAKSDGHFDILFVPVGGYGGIPSIATFYKRLKIPVAAIVDLDVVLEQPQLRNILSQLAPEKSAAIDEIIHSSEQVSALIVALPPLLDPNDIRSALSELNERNTWDDNETTALMKLLRGLANKLDRRKVLKAGGVATFGERIEIQNLLTKIIDGCKDFGLFLVPVGELEYWATDAMTGVSKEKKAEWANAAAICIKNEPDKTKDVIEFIRNVGTMLENERNVLLSISEQTTQVGQ